MLMAQGDYIDVYGSPHKSISTKYKLFIIILLKTLAKRNCVTVSPPCNWDVIYLNRVEMQLFFKSLVKSG